MSQDAKCGAEMFERGPACIRTMGHDGAHAVSEILQWSYRLCWAKGAVEGVEHRCILEVDHLGPHGWERTAYPTAQDIARMARERSQP